jgi:CRISPR-associated protein Cmr1
MMQLTAHFRVVTPLFLGGAENTAEAELRPASIKGALRFWWRALQWGRGVTTVAELKREEDRLFGSSEGGQARFLLSIEYQQRPTEINNGKILSKTGAGPTTGSRNAIVGEGARYLGYGLMGAFGQSGGVLSRPCIAAPFEFTVRLSFKRGTEKTEIAEIADALKLLGLCGGLGSRNRRGWGSVTLTNLIIIKDGADKEIWQAPKTLEDHAAAIKKIVGRQNNENTGACGTLPEWTAFAAGHSKLVLLQGSGTNPLATLSEMGKDFLFFRSWGHKGQHDKEHKTLKETSEQNFKDDHDLFKNYEFNPQDRPQQHPQRIVFGLPQNYKKARKGQDSNENAVIPAGNGLERRSSPLFFHVHQVTENEKAIGVLVYLPARFLPKGNDKVKFGNSPVALGQNGGVPFWQPAEDFLQRILSADGKHPVKPPLKESKATTFQETLEVQI